MIGSLAIGLLAAANPAQGLLDPKPPLFVWTLVVFLLTLLVLWKGGWKMMIAKLDARDEAIRGSIERAKEEREAAQKLLEEHKKMLDDGRRQAAEMLSNAQQEAVREKERIVAEARSEYEGIVSRGREQIEQDKRAALAEIRGTVADLSLQVAGQLLGKSLDDASQRRLAESFIAELERKGGRPEA